MASVALVVWILASYVVTTFGAGPANNTTSTPTRTTLKLTRTTHKPTTHKPTTHKPTTHKPTPTTHKPTPTHKPTTTLKPAAPAEPACGFGVDFDAWMGQSVPMKVLRPFCYSNGLCKHNEKKPSFWCKVIADQMKRLMNDPKEKDSVFKILLQDEGQPFNCDAVNKSKLHTLVQQKHFSLSELDPVLRLKDACEVVCTETSHQDNLCYLAMVLLENFADTEIEKGKSAAIPTTRTRPTNRTTQNTTDDTTSHATATAPATSNATNTPGPHQSLENSSSLSKMSTYIILLVAAMFASGLAYLAYINWGTIKGAVYGGKPTRRRPKKKGYSKVKLASVRDAMP